MRKAEWISSICFLLAITLFIAVFSQALMPVRTSYGANWGAFLKEGKDSVDVMFFGSSLVYCDIMPEIISEETGYSAYVLAGPEQTIPVTYYYIREAFRTQSPSFVFIEVTGIFYPKYTNFTKANIGYMPWSYNRIEATFHTSEKEEWLGLLFPLYNYHDRWSSLRIGDFFNRYQVDEMRGYTLLTEAVKMKGITTREVKIYDETYDENISY